ncbi:MAG: hypothetical protein M1550_01535 [Deltaproteobacteria bacterium]|nr:hypothetical protein [Deltaproteobacteria bacterium]
MKIRTLAPCLVLIAFLSFAGTAIAGAPLDITLFADGRNPQSPQMGDRLTFRSVIRNTGRAPAEGVVAWISLVRVDAGHEQPVDLEDWSALKAVTRAALAPGEQVEAEWPMRLIQAGDYRVVISAVARGAGRIVTSPFADFHVRRKPVVESRRILPVAFGIPLAMGGLVAFRLVRRR